MKNITLSVDDETYRLSRIRAAAAGTTVSALVRGLLMRIADAGSDGHQSQTAEFARLVRLQEEVIAELRGRPEPFHADDRASRDALHERDAVR